MKHVITDNLKHFKRRELNAPDGYHFDTKFGGWVSDTNVNEILVKAKGRPTKATKKNDIETGEDLKSS